MDQVTKVSPAGKPEVWQDEKGGFMCSEHISQGASSRKECAGGKGERPCSLTQ